MSGSIWDLVELELSDWKPEKYLARDVWKYSAQVVDIRSVKPAFLLKIAVLTVTRLPSLSDRSFLEMQI